MMIFLVPASVAVIREIRTVDTHGVRWVDASPLCLVHRTKAASSTKGWSSRLPLNPCGMGSCVSYEALQHLCFL